MRKQLHLLCTVFLLIGAPQVRAQVRNQNWYFGNKAAVSFSGGAPKAFTGSAMYTYEATANISDPLGNLLFYTNSEKVWNRNNQVMPNGGRLGGNNSSTQGAVILQNPTDAPKYYVFIAPETAVQNLVGGLRYFTVDMTANGGLGDAGPVATLYNPAAGGLSERLIAVRHQNGRDTWIVVHNFPGNTFYAFLVSPAGIAQVPVASSVGAFQSGGGGNFNANNSVGYLRASVDGSHLAMTQRTNPPELFDFDNATGRVSNAVLLSQNPFWAYYGMEFSPDGSRLYGSTIDGYGITQWNLTAGSPAAVVASATSIAGNAGSLGALARGPDDKIYVSIYNAGYLAAIPNPNALGVACGYVSNAVFLEGATCQYGLPNVPSWFLPGPPVLAVAAAATSCAGAPVAFGATLSPAAANAVITWNFGDPTAGAANTATGPGVSHAYASAGTYTATASVVLPSGTLTAQQTVTVAPLPAVSLAPRQRTLCAGQVLNIGTSGQPAGTTYRWEDGPTTATREVRAPGRYVLTVTSSQGCSARDSVNVEVAPLPVLHLAPPATLCSEAQPVVLRPNAQPAGTAYRWQDGTTTETYAARRPGRYRLEVRTAAGCFAADSVEVRGPHVDGECVPVKIPNIITPNGDQQNQAFVLQGLTAPDWALAIYNRWGREIYRQPHYANDWSAAGQPDGQYYYLLTNPATGGKYQGWLQVLR